MTIGYLTTPGEYIGVWVKFETVIKSQPTLVNLSPEIRETVTDAWLNLTGHQTCIRHSRKDVPTPQCWVGCGAVQVKACHSLTGLGRQQAS